MAHSHKKIVTEIQADEKVMLANRKAMDKVQIQYQCKCPHRDANGGLALIVPNGKNAKKSPFTGAPLYMCKVCKKELDISNISEEEFARSLDVINRVFELSKMHLDIGIEKDQETLTQLAKMEYRNIAVLPDAFKTIRKGGRRNKKKSNNPSSDYIEVNR